MNKIKILTIIICILIIVGIICFIMFNKKEKPSDFSIHFFNAGKADAILISNNDNYILIDTAEESFGDNILKYFKDNNINKLDYLIITHFDKDHVGSASKIIDNIEIGSVFESNYPKESEYYNKYLESLSKKNITANTIMSNYNSTLGDMEIIINGPDKEYEDNKSNNSSLIVSLKYKDTSFLFMGDAQNARIKDYIEEVDTTYDFIKMPHHGDHYKSLRNLLEKTNPSVAVITSSLEKPEDTKTIKLLNELEIDYYLTRNGDINILSDGETIYVKN